MSNFRSTAESALHNARLGQYTRQAEPVPTAVANKEADVVRRLTQAATQQGLTQQAARALLRSAGLHAPEPTPPAPRPVAQTPQQAAVVSGETLARLIAFAEQHGFRA